MKTGTCERCGDPFEDRSPAQSRRFCSDHCRKRNGDETHRSICGSCGAAMGQGSEWDDTRVCATCHQTRNAGRREHFIALRREGLTNLQIAARERVSHQVVATELYRAKHWDGMDVPPPPYWSRAT